MSPLLTFSLFHSTDLVDWSWLVVGISLLGNCNLLFLVAVLLVAKLLSFLFFFRMCRNGLATLFFLHLLLEHVAEVSLRIVMNKVFHFVKLVQYLVSGILLVVLLLLQLHAELKQVLKFPIEQLHFVITKLNTLIKLGRSVCSRFLLTKSRFALLVGQLCRISGVFTAILFGLPFLLNTLQGDVSLQFFCVSMLLLQARIMITVNVTTTTTAAGEVI